MEKKAGQMTNDPPPRGVLLLTMHPSAEALPILRINVTDPLNFAACLII